MTESKGLKSSSNLFSFTYAWNSSLSIMFNSFFLVLVYSHSTSSSVTPRDGSISKWFGFSCPPVNQDLNTRKFHTYIITSWYNYIGWPWYYRKYIPLFPLLPHNTHSSGNEALWRKSSRTALSINYIWLVSIVQEWHFPILVIYSAIYWLWTCEAYPCRQLGHHCFRQWLVASWVDIRVDSIHH